MQAIDFNAVVKINEQRVSSLPLVLNVGSNVYKIKVLSQDETQSVSYTLTISVVNDQQPVEPGSLEIQTLTAKGARVVLLSNGNYVIQYPEGTSKVEIYAMSPYSQLPINTIPYKSGQDFPINEDITKLVIVLKTQTKQKQYEVALLSYPKDDANFIKFGGDVELTLSKFDFQDKLSDNLLTTIKTTKDKITFNLDFSADITVNALYGTEDVGEVRVLTNGHTRIVFNSVEIQKDGTPIVLQITDNNSGETRTYIIKVIKDDNNLPLIMIIAASLMMFLALVLVIIVFVKLRKNKKQQTQQDY